MFLSSKNKLNWCSLGIAFAVTVVAVFVGIFGVDEIILNFLRKFDWRIWHIIDDIFSTKNWLIISLLFVLAFYVRKMIYTKSGFKFLDIYTKIKTSYAFYIFCSIVLAVVIGGPLKFIIGRMGPIFYGALGTTGFYPFAHDWAFHSMPSGHTLASFAGLVAIGIIAPRAKWFTWTLATVIGISRVCVGAHWPSDVVFGAFIGVFSACAVRAFILKHNK